MHPSISPSRKHVSNKVISSLFACNAPPCCCPINISQLSTTSEANLKFFDVFKTCFYTMLIWDTFVFRIYDVYISWLGSLGKEAWGSLKMFTIGCHCILRLPALTCIHLYVTAPTCLNSCTCILMQPNSTFFYANRFN